MRRQSVGRKARQRKLARKAVPRAEQDFCSQEGAEEAEVGERDQTLAQMAIAWLLKDKRVTSVLVGASKVSQLKDNIATLQKLDFTSQELTKIETILKKE